MITFVEENYTNILSFTSHSKIFLFKHDYSHLIYFQAVCKGTNTEQAKLRRIVATLEGAYL